MLTRALAGARTAGHAIGRVIANRDMRRAVLGYMFGCGAEWAWLVALAVYAFNAGGLAVVGIVGLARTLPAAILAPALGSLADRFPRHRVLLAVHAGRASLLALAAVVAAVNGPPLLVYAIATLDALLAVLHRPTHLSLLPALARSPEQLIAANVSSSTVEAVGILLGPMIGAVLIASGAVPLTFAVPAAMFAAAAISVAGLRPSEASEQRVPASGGSFLRGLRALREHPHAALIVSLFGSQTAVRGILSVLIVAGSIEMLGMGDEGVGYLNAAIGAGGVVGAVATAAMVGRRRMAPQFFLGLLLWGLPILVAGLLPFAVVALLAMAVLGAGNAVLDVSGFTLLQRTVPNAARGSVFGVFEAVVMLTVGLGSLLAPALVALVGVQGAWIVAGSVLPLLAIVTWRGLRAADERAVVPERELALLRGVPMLGMLPLTALEQVAADLTPLRFEAGDTIIREGDAGDRFYVVASGEVEVRQDRERIRTMGVGESFGEVALLRNVPRTAGVVAIGPVEVFAIGRVAFRCAVTEDHQSLQAAEQVVTGFVPD
jgi:MFS family permease